MSMIPRRPSDQRALALSRFIIGKGTGGDGFSTIDKRLCNVGREVNTFEPGPSVAPKSTSSAADQASASPLTNIINPPDYPSPPTYFFMRSAVLRGGALLGTGITGFLLLNRKPGSHQRNMSPARLQSPDGTDGGAHQSSGTDAMEAMKSGILGHTAQMAGVTRGGALKGVDAFETTFAVPMHCESCVKDIEGTVTGIDGIESARADLSSGLLHIKGTAAPSVVVGTLQAAGRDAILRGSGASNSAAVCILELDTPRIPGKSPVRGLARLVQVNKTHTLIDLTLSGMEPGRYEARIRTAGNISEGIASLGKVWAGTEGLSTREGITKGDLGTVEVDEKGRGAAYIAQKMSVWEIIGRGMSVMKEGADVSVGEGVCGVLARSAGVWENDKVVCSCSGKTVWQEREEQTGRGML